MPCQCLQFFWPWFLLPHPIVIVEPLNWILWWVNSQKCLMKIQYCNCDGGGDENHSWNYVFDFFGAIFVTYRGSCDDCDGEEGGSVWVIGWWKSRLKKSYRRFWFFWPWFSSPNFSHQQFEKNFENCFIIFWEIFWKIVRIIVENFENI